MFRSNSLKFQHSRVSVSRNRILKVPKPRKPCLEEQERVFISKHTIWKGVLVSTFSSILSSLRHVGRWVFGLKWVREWRWWHFVWERSCVEQVVCCFKKYFRDLGLVGCTQQMEVNVECYKTNESGCLIGRNGQGTSWEVLKGHIFL